MIGRRVDLFRRRPGGLIRHVEPPALDVVGGVIDPSRVEIAQGVRDVVWDEIDDAVDDATWRGRYR